MIYTLTLDLCKMFECNNYAIIMKEKNGWKHYFSDDLNFSQ